MVHKLLLIGLLFLQSTLTAQVFSESFIAETSSPLTSLGWVEHSGNGSNPISTVQGLSFGSKESLGMAASLNSSGQDVHKSFAAINRAAVYLAAWINVSEAQTGGEYFLHLGPASLGTEFRARVFIRKTTDTQFRVGVSKSSNDPNYANTDYDLNTTYLLVVKYQFLNSSSQDDIVELSVLSPDTDLTEEVFMVSAKDGEFDAPSIGSVALRQGSRSRAANLLVDEIKVGTSWEDVTAFNSDPFVNLTLPESPYYYSSNCSEQPFFKSSLLAQGQGENLNVWSPDASGFEFSLNGREWQKQLRFFSNNGAYSETFYIRAEGSYTGRSSEIIVDDQEANELLRTASTFTLLTVDNDCSLPIGVYRKLPKTTIAKVKGIVTASANEFGNFNYLQDTSGGIRVQGNYNWSIGDSVYIEGVLGEVFSEIAIEKDTSIAGDSATRIFGKGSIPKPRIITLDELDKHQGDLVEIKGFVFKDPNFVLLPNTNEKIESENLTAEIRIWGSTDLDGLQKNSSPQNVIGVAGRFRDNFQLYPRVKSDLADLDNYDFPPLSLPITETFDVAAWNVEWFGNPGNGPIDDELQLANAVTVINRVNADAWILTEISNVALFDQLKARTGLEGLCSEAVSNGSADGNAQRVCLLYNTQSVSLASHRPLLSSLGVIPGYPTDFNRFWASGRLPALFVLDVNLNGITRRLHVVGVHARANTSSSDERELRYAMRKADVEILKDSLDQQLSLASVIIAGDYNDDLDESVVQGIQESSYSAYVNDTENWTMVSKTLSEKGYKSFIGFDNVIDHIGFSNELNSSYVEGSVFLDLPFVDIDDYTNTTSDHLPIVARFYLEETITSNDLLEVDSFLVYPNPTTGQFNIQYDTKGDTFNLQVLNQQGQLLGTFEGEKTKVEKKVSKLLSKSNPGIYLVRLKVGNRFKSYKLVREG